MPERVTCLTHKALGDEYTGLRTGISYDSAVPNIRLLTVPRGRILNIDGEFMLKITSAQQTLDPHVFIERTVNEKVRPGHLPAVFVRKSCADTTNFGDLEGGSRLEVFSDGIYDSPHYHLMMDAQIRDLSGGGFWQDLSMVDEVVRKVVVDIMIGLCPTCQVKAGEGVTFYMGNRPVLFFNDQFYCINEEMTDCHSYDTKGQWVKEGEYPYRSHFAQGGIGGYVEVLAGDMCLDAARLDHWPISSVAHVYRFVCGLDLLYTTFSDINQAVTRMVSTGQRDDSSLRSIVNPYLMITRTGEVT